MAVWRQKRKKLSSIYLLFLYFIFCYSSSRSMLLIMKLLKARRFSFNILILNLRAKFENKLFGWFLKSNKDGIDKKKEKKIGIQKLTGAGLCWLRALRWREHGARCSTESRIAYGIYVPLAIVFPTMPASVYQFDERRLDRAI